VPAHSTDLALAKKALAHANWSSVAYDKKLYRLPQQPAKKRISTASSVY